MSSRKKSYCRLEIAVKCGEVCIGRRAIVSLKRDLFSATDELFFKALDAHSKKTKLRPLR